MHFLNSNNFIPTVYKSVILRDNEQIIYFSVTISYGRYGEFIPQPLEFDDQCDLCKNTLYVKPDAASELFPGCRVEEGWPGMKDFGAEQRKIGNFHRHILFTNERI